MQFKRLARRSSIQLQRQVGFVGSCFILYIFDVTPGLMITSIARSHYHIVNTLARSEATCAALPQPQTRAALLSLRDIGNNRTLSSVPSLSRSCRLLFSTRLNRVASLSIAILFDVSANL
jgi:hypothetical protein